MSMSKISRFTKKAVRLAKNAVGGRGEVAAPEGGGGFAEYAVLSLHCLRVYLEMSYRETLDLLSEMPHILGEIGLELADLPHHSTLVKWFDKIKKALSPSDELPRSDAQSNSSRRHRKPSNSGRSLYDRETSRHTARLAGLPPQRGRPRQPRCGQRLRLDGFTRESPRGG